MSNLKAVPEKTDLPDDPAACCRAILDALKASSVSEWPQTSIAADYARLSRTILDASEDAKFELGPCIPALSNLAMQAEDAAEEYHSIFERVWTLARHGTGEHRAMDAITAARGRAVDAEESPPDWLSCDMVRKRVQKAAEAGETLSEAEAVERLVAEGPPPLSHGQQRLMELVDAVSKLKGEKADRLLATARELVEETDAA